jgi:7-cyano-7-deazaguanine synthase
MITTPSHTTTTGLLFSGGLDSGILLGHLLAEGRRVRPFYVRAHLWWEDAELQAAEHLLAAMRSPALDPLVVLEMPLKDLYGNHWSVNGHDTPAADSPDEAVYLPGRNALLAIKPLLWCAMHGIEELALAVLAANPFADASDEFFRDFESALERASGSRVRLVRPFAGLDKKDVMHLGGKFPLGLTFSCIAPVDGLHCGRCNKCAERRCAFSSVNVDDPTQYAG